MKRNNDGGKHGSSEYPMLAPPALLLVGSAAVADALRKIISMQHRPPSGIYDLFFRVPCRTGRDFFVWIILLSIGDQVAAISASHAILDPDRACSAAQDGTLSRQFRSAECAIE